MLHVFCLTVVAYALFSKASITSFADLYVFAGRLFSNHSFSALGTSEKLLHASTKSFLVAGYLTCFFACIRTACKTLTIFSPQS